LDGLEFIVLAYIAVSLGYDVMSIILMKALGGGDVTWGTALILRRSQELIRMDLAFYLSALLVCAVILYWASRRRATGEAVFWVIVFAYFLIVAVLRVVRWDNLGLLLVVDSVFLFLLSYLHRGRVTSRGKTGQTNPENREK
jgi:hypothetical protein